MVFASVPRASDWVTRPHITIDRRHHRRALRTARQSMSAGKQLSFHHRHLWRFLARGRLHRIQSRVQPRHARPHHERLHVHLHGHRPISAAITGLLMQHATLKQLFVASSVLLLIIVVIALIRNANQTN